MSYGARRQDQAWLSELAGQAFAYEDCIFDSAQQNWPDLRHYHSWRATRVMPPPHQVAWCHGAAGIALSRLRAFEITGDATFAEAARKAGATVQRGACEELAWRKPRPACATGSPAMRTSWKRSGSGLMLGTAGLGAFLLYVAGSIPASLLMPTLTTASPVRV